MMEKFIGKKIEELYDFPKENIKATKAFLLRNELKLNNLVEEYVREGEAYREIRNSNKYYVEITTPGISKNSAIEYCKNSNYLSVPVYFIGDGKNDLEIMRNEDVFSFAVRNAIEDVHSIASRSLSESVYENPIAEVINHLEITYKNSKKPK